MKILYIVLVFSTTLIFAQESNIAITSNSAMQLYAGSTICTDNIEVEPGSSFTANDYGQVRDSGCNEITTPTGGGTVNLPVEIDDIGSLPTKFTIENAHPNPFNPTTTIRYGIAEQDKITLKIYDINGQLIRTLFNDYQEQGWYEITWDGKMKNGCLAPAGIYLYEVTTGREIKTAKISLIK